MTPIFLDTVGLLAIWDIATLRQAIYQVLRALTLIMLLLFEMGVGLFLEAKDIPAGVWAVAGGFGAAYIIFMCIFELMQGPRIGDYVLDGGNGIRGN